MRIDEGDRVVSADGNELGSVKRVVVHPGTFEVTHVVVSGGLLRDERVIETEALRERDESTLEVTRAVDADALPAFEERHVIPVETSAADLPARNPVAWYYPYGMAGVSPAFAAVPSQPTEVTRNVPAETNALALGAEVVSSDREKVGSVEEVITDDDDNLRSFIVSSGWIFKDRTMIPIDWVAAVEEEAVRLSVRKDVLEALPPYHRP